MKKALLFAAVLLVFTNPHPSAHEQALLAKELAGLPAAGLPNSPLVAGELRRTVARRTRIRNYGFFSITTVNYSDILPASTNDNLLNRNIGIGILGRVYLWGGM